MGPSRPNASPDPIASVPARNLTGTTRIGAGDSSPVKTAMTRGIPLPAADGAILRTNHAAAAAAPPAIPTNTTNPAGPQPPHLGNQCIAKPTCFLQGEPEPCPNQSGTHAGDWGHRTQQEQTALWFPRLEILGTNLHIWIQTGFLSLNEKRSKDLPEMQANGSTMPESEAVARKAPMIGRHVRVICPGTQGWGNWTVNLSRGATLDHHGER